MKTMRSVTGFSAGIGMLLLIFDSRLAMEGARSGLELCVSTVIPSLFPFIVLSMLLTNALSVSRSRLLTFAAGIMGIPETAAPIIIPALLGGYPVGAKCVHDLYTGGQIDKNQAEHLLAFCSNAGPAFIFGIAASLFPGVGAGWKLWLIQILSVLLTAFWMPVPQTDPVIPQKTSQEREINVLPSAVKAMALICGWVILFRIVTAFLKSWCLWLLPRWLQVFVTGFLELTNGCCDLIFIKDLKMRFLLCSGMLSLGGVCVLMQTASVSRGLSLKYYIPGKCLQTGISLLMSASLFPVKGWIIAGGLLFVMILVRKSPKRSGNSVGFPV